MKEAKILSCSTYSSCQCISGVYCYKLPILKNEEEKNIYICRQCGKILKQDEISQASEISNVSNDQIRRLMLGILRFANINNEEYWRQPGEDYEYLSEKKYYMKKTNKKHFNRDKLIVPIKRGRGRPKKIIQEQVTEQPKRKRGRPRKIRE